MHSLSPRYIGVNSTFQTYFKLYSIDVILPYPFKLSATSSFEIKQTFTFLWVLVIEPSLELQNLRTVYILREFIEMTYSL